MKIGVVSDTHGFFDPRLAEVLAGVELILHGGDVGAQEVLDELARIAPVQAVQGNVDSAHLGLPLSRTLRFEKIQVELMHQLSVSQAEVEAWSDGGSLEKRSQARRESFLRDFDRLTRVVIFGHSHQPCLLTLGQKLFFNPGSAGKRRFSLPRCCGVLEVLPQGVWGTVVALERYNEILPPKVRLPVGE